MVDNKLITTIEDKTFNFDLPKDADINLKHDIYSISIIKDNELGKQQKTRLVIYCAYVSTETISMNTENNKTNELHKFVLNLPRKALDIKSSSYLIAVFH